MTAKNFVRNVARKFGYTIQLSGRPIYADQTQFERSVAVVRGATMLPHERMVSLYDQVSYCDRIGLAGALVECGVWKGGAVGLMALATMAHGGSPRDLHLFDSFTDICPPDPAVDGDRAIQESGGRATADAQAPQPMEGFYDSVGGHGTRADCERLIEGTIGYPSAAVHYHQGWFQDTVPETAKSIGPVAVLRLDGDWYASTMICLEHLYANVVEGGIVILDDYGTYDGCRRAVDEFLATRGIDVFLNRVDAGCYYFVKPAN